MISSTLEMGVMQEVSRDTGVANERRPISSQQPGIDERHKNSDSLAVSLHSDILESLGHG
jgi:hypothetical protein